MVNHRGQTRSSQATERYDRTFRALGDATRRGIVERLARGETSLGDLAEPTGLSLPAVLKHLRVLEDAGLVSTTKEGRVRRCRLETAQLARATRWLESRQALWERRLGSLGNQLRKEKLQ